MEFHYLDQPSTITISAIALTTNWIQWMQPALENLFVLFFWAYAQDVLELGKHMFFFVLTLFLFALEKYKKNQWLISSRWSTVVTQNIITMV